MSFFRGHHIVSSLTIAICAGDPVVLDNVRMKKVVLRVERFIARLPLFYIVVAKFALYYFEYAFWPLVPKVRPFSTLALSDQLAYLDHWGKSRFYTKRILYKMLVTLCLPEVFSERRLLRKMGYDEALDHREAAGSVEGCSKDILFRRGEL